MTIVGERLKGKVAIVTGGAAGIGRATCELFAEEGARVVVADVDEPQGHALANAIGHAGGQAVFVRTDISLEDDARRLVAEAMHRFGAVDVLVNNAATFVLKGIDENFGVWEGVDVGSDSHDESAGVRQDGERRTHPVPQTRVRSSL